MIKELVENLNLPLNRILFLHVKLKGIDDDICYAERTKLIIKYIEELYKPKTILIPTFTYSFTKTGIFNRATSSCEVGRFGEEARMAYSSRHRTINPVFSVIDTNQYFSSYNIDETTAFGQNSLFDLLNDIGHVIVNINLERILFTFLHYIEEQKEVFYRYNKTFKGKVSCDGKNYRFIKYNYFVRDLELDTRRRYNKTKNFLLKRGALKESCSNTINSCWIYSDELFQHISEVIDKYPDFTITD
ncbi:AAC(3) family N-acetyltransferase [Marinilabiliaceae bacterium ANBcel2]|nr:AAC(3) family N-acetyltransferase [Marinilabiliaceae bacterium ANBcel2]